MSRVLFLLVSFFPAVITAYAGGKPGAKQGSMDLTRISWQRNTTVELNGEWEFYWEELLTPKDFEHREAGQVFIQLPSLWNDQQLTAQSYATYRLRVYINDNAGSLALLAPNVYTSYRLFIDGELRAQDGVVSEQKETAKPEWRGNLVFLASPKDTIEIVLQVSNFDHYRGGVHKPFILGSAQGVLRNREILIISDMLLVGGLLVLAASFLVFYSYRLNMLQCLYFGLFCLFWAIRSLVTHVYVINHLYPTMEWSVALRIEYMALYISFLMAILFIHKVFHYNNRLLTALMVIINFLFIASVMVLPTTFFTALLNGFFTFAGVSLLNCFYVIVMAILRKQKEAWFSATGILIGLIIFVVEFFGYNLFLPVNLVYLNLAYLTVFFVNGLVLIYGFVKAYQQVEQLESEKSALFKTIRR